MYHANCLVRLGLLDGLMLGPLCWNIGVNCLFQVHNDATSSCGTEPTTNFAIARFHSYRHGAVLVDFVNVNLIVDKCRFCRYKIESVMDYEV